MLNPADLYSWFESVPIVIDGKQIGTMQAEYEVHEYVDVRNLSDARSYYVTSKQRFIIPNQGVKKLGPVSVDEYLDYPVMLVSSVGLGDLPNATVINLMDYSPKTVNSSVSTSRSDTDDTGTTTSLSRQHTSGSSTSETNSYDVNVSLGFFGDAPTGGVGFGAGWSESSGREVADSTEKSHGLEMQRSSSSSSAMSLKDWGSFAAPDVANAVPTWVWAQEYPWDVTQFHNAPNGAGTDVTLPDFVKARLWDNGTQVYPPSQLSLFGINLVCTAKWIVTLPGGTAADETLSFAHSLEYYTGSHSIDTNSKLLACLSAAQKFSYTSPEMDMVQLGLDPIAREGIGNGAIVGFALPQFIAPPSAKGGFRIKSLANNLLVSGSGFDEPASADAPLTTDFSSSPKAILDVYFKVVDPAAQLTLFLKHWKTTSAGCVMTITINGSEEIVRHVDALEAGSGADNIATITLRNLDYSSSEFYDYLAMGLNHIVITIAPDATGTQTGYAIRALAIG